MRFDNTCWFLLVCLFTDSGFILQVAVCNLASIALNMFVKPDHTYDFMKLREITKVITRNLNKIIEVNYYPVPEVIDLWFSSII